MSKIAEIATAVEHGKQKLIEELVKEALKAGVPANTILNDGMITAMGIVGAKFQADEIFVPEMLIAAKTMKKGVEVLRPHLTGDSVGKHGKFIIGTIAGDLHDIGKNLVALMIESAGFEVIDLGIDVPADKFIETVKANPDCKLVGLSGLLTTTMETMKNTIIDLENAGCRNQIKIMVGGAPITQEFADEIGADAFSINAGAAAVKAVQLVS